MGGFGGGKFGEEREDGLFPLLCPFKGEYGNCNTITIIFLHFPFDSDLGIGYNGNNKKNSQ